MVSFGQKFDHANISHECNQCAMENRLINFEELNDNSHAAPLDSTFLLSLPQVCIWYIWCVIATLTAVFVCGVLLNKSEAPWDAFHFCMTNYTPRQIIAPIKKLNQRNPDYLYHGQFICHLMQGCSKI